MAFNIESMKSAVKSIARSTLFDVTIYGSSMQGVDSRLMQFTCKAASLPQDTVGKIDVPFFGRKIPFAGDRVHQDWTTTIIMDQNYTIYKQLWNWKQRWNASVENIASSNNMLDYKCDGTVQVYDATGIPKMTIKLVGMFPYDVQQLDLSWENNDATVDLQVTWFYDYFMIV